MTRDVVVFVCSGNTCRSPLAEIGARHRCASAAWRFVSAGLDAAPGSPASAGSCDEARERGWNLDDHRSRRLDADVVDDAAWLVGMTGEHAARIRERYPDFGGRVGKLGLPGVDLRRRLDDDGEDVDDPWRQGTERAYALMAEQVERLVGAWCDILAREEP